MDCPAHHPCSDLSACWLHCCCPQAATSDYAWWFQCPAATDVQGWPAWIQLFQSVSQLSVVAHQSQSSLRLWRVSKHLILGTVYVIDLVPFQDERPSTHAPDQDRVVIHLDGSHFPKQHVTFHWRVY